MIQSLFDEIRARIRGAADFLSVYNNAGEPSRDHAGYAGYAAAAPSAAFTALRRFRRSHKLVDFCRF